ncbi:hypothetical protein J6590_065966 [Homalodisca vitripennis]|nr:hypothetical protein J6590_065966 [Homalodisca vitripennis]
MLERVVGRMFRAATSRTENCSNPVNMNASTSHDSTNGQPTQARLQGDVQNLTSVLPHLGLSGHFLEANIEILFPNGLQTRSYTH